MRLHTCLAILVAHNRIDYFDDVLNGDKYDAILINNLPITLTEGGMKMILIADRLIAWA